MRSEGSVKSTPVCCLTTKGLEINSNPNVYIAYVCEEVSFSFSMMPTILFDDATHQQEGKHYAILPTSSSVVKSKYRIDPLFDSPERYIPGAISVTTSL
jgi:hypothetical protein